MQSETGAVRSEQSTAKGMPGFLPYPGLCSHDSCNSISSPVDFIFLKTEPPFIQVYCHCAKSFTYIISLNLKPALCGGCYCTLIYRGGKRGCEGSHRAECQC